MKKFTEQDVRAVEPDLTDQEVANVLDMLNAEPRPMRERWEAENDELAEELINPPKRGPDGLTDPMRQVNDFAEKQGLPIVFPPDT